MAEAVAIELVFIQDHDEGAWQGPVAKGAALSLHAAVPEIVHSGYTLDP
jgi:hypothetical protein